MDTIGIIDMGSNSVRLILVRVFKDLSFRLMDEHKESIRLGDGIDEFSNLKEDKIQDALKTMKMFKRLCDAQNATKIIAVATAAVRKANNGQELIDRIYDETNIDMKVISGKDEAYFDYLAVSHSVFSKDGLILDIGGGSFELVLMKNRELIESVSIPMGSIDFAQKFKIKDPLTKDEEKKMMKFISDKLKEVQWLKSAKNLPLIGVGGTLRNIGKINMLKRNYPIDILHNYEVKTDEVFEIYDELKAMDYESKKSYPGLSSDRADIFIGSLSLVSAIMKQINSDKLIVSGKGVREGLFYNYLLDKNVYVDNPLMLSLENTTKIMGLDLVHSYQVRKLTKRLFDLLKPVHKITDDVGNIIDTSSLLHDAGIIINYYNHHRNSFFVILNSQVNGLSHKELLMSAYIASMHRKNKALENYSRYKLLLDSEDVQKIKKIAIFLRIAESLDKSMSCIVSDLEIEIKKDKVIVKVISKDNPEVELNDARAAISAFKKLYKLDLVIE